MRNELNNDNIVKRLSGTDFSSQCDTKNHIRNRLLKQIDSGETAYEASKARPAARRWRPVAVTAAALVMCFSLSAMYGSNILGAFRGFTASIQARFDIIDSTKEIVPFTEALPPEFAGKLFDAEGNVLTALLKGNVPAYNKNGEPLTPVFDEGAQMVMFMTEAEFKELQEYNKSLWREEPGEPEPLPDIEGLMGKVYDAEGNLLATVPADGTLVPEAEFKTRR